MALHMLNCDFLNVTCCRCGGVEMISQHGKIKLDNTLDSRLQLISHQVS